MVKTSRRQLRKIDGLEHMKALELVNELTASRTADNLFVEDKEGGLKGVPKALREKIAVMDKKGRVAVGKGEQLVLKKMIEKRSEAKVPAPAKKQQIAKSNVFDAWAGPAVSKRKQRPVNVSFVPSVVLPHAGQSINPEPNAYVELVTSVADRELPKPKMKAAETPLTDVTTVSPVEEDNEEAFEKSRVRAAQRKTTQDRNKAERHKELLAKHSENRMIKKISKQINHLPAIAKEVLSAEAELAERAKLRTDQREETLQQTARGVVTVRGPGGKFNETAMAISKPSEDGSMRKVTPAVNPVNERMQSVFRQRLLEQRPQINGEFLNKIKAQKTHKNRFHKFADPDARDIALLR